MKYTEKELINIKNEAKRCLYCYDAPCIKACPAKINIPEFIKAIAEDNNKRATLLVYEENPLSAICSEICPTDELCRGSCNLGKLGKPINIPLLQNYAASFKYATIHNKYIGRKVAIVGAGPGGLAAAEFLLRAGIGVKIFEKENHIGGIIDTILPKERITEEAKKRDFERILKKELKIEYNKAFGKNLFLKDLIKEYDAVIIATGLYQKGISIKGTGHKNVFLVNDFLHLNRLSRPKKLGHHIVVIGGGAAAIDCAIQAFKVGKKVSIYYRRSRAEMPATKEELENADNTGVSFNYLASPIQINRNNQGDLFVEFIENKLVKVTLGRPKPIPIKDSNFKVKCSAVVLATGQGYDKKIFQKMGIVLDNNGPVVGDDYQTSIDNVYLVGDVVNGGATAVEAVKIAKMVTKLIKAEM